MLRNILFTAFLFSACAGLCVAQTAHTYNVPFYKNQANVLEIDIKINNFPSRFIFDPGATLVSFGMNFYRLLYKNGSISDSDTKYRTSSKLANGTLANAFIINIKKINIGNFEVDDVDALVLEVDEAPLLLGQSIIQQFSTYTIDNDNNAVVFTRQSIPASIFIHTINFVPCSTFLVNDTENIRKGLNQDSHIKIEVDSVAGNIPVSADVLDRITHKVTIRYFDSSQLANALFLQKQIVSQGYRKSDVFVEDMTPYYQNPIVSYIEIWTK